MFYENETEFGSLGGSSNLNLKYPYIIWCWKFWLRFFFRICQSWEWNKLWVLHTILCTQKAASLFNKLRLGGGGQCLKILLTPWFASKIKWKIEIKLNECFEVWYSTFIISNSLYTVHYIHYTMYHIDQISVHLKPNKRADLCEKSFCD